MLAIIGSINRAMASYLRAKVLSSLAMALPVVAILWTFGVSFPGMWGVLAFVGNFIPYVGSVIALVLPVLLALLELEPPWRPLAVLALLLLAHFVTNNFIEPRLTAHAVDLSPFMVLVALAFWALCWGVGRDGAGRAFDSDGKDRVRERRTHSSPGSADVRGVKKERPRDHRSHGDQWQHRRGLPDLHLSARSGGACHDLVLGGFAVLSRHRDGARGRKVTFQPLKKRPHPNLSEPRAG